MLNIIRPNNDAPINKINSINNVVMYPSHDLQVKHIVYTSTGPDNEVAFIYGNQKGVNYMFDTNGFISIERRKKEPNGKRISFKMTQSEGPNMVFCIEEMYKWLTDKDYKDIFQYNSDTQLPININRSVSTQVISKNGSRYLKMFVTIIEEEANGCTYEGVGFRSDEGLIGYMTAFEFSTFRMRMLPVINNLYTNNNLLLIMAMVYSSSQGRY